MDKLKNWFGKNKVKGFALLLALLTSLGVTLSPDARNTVSGWLGISAVSSGTAPVGSDTAPVDSSQ